MLNLAELMVLACERWKTKVEFDVACKPHQSRPGAFYIHLNGKNFGFDGNSSPFNPIAASKVCKSKIDTIDLVNQVQLKAGAHVPKTRANYDPDLHEAGARDEKLRRFLATVDDICADAAGVFTLPVIVKPNSKSMSVNGSLARTPEELRESIEQIFADSQDYDSDAIVQERIDIKTEYRAVCFDGQNMMLIERDTQNATPNDILNPVFWEGTRNKLVFDEELAMASEEIAEVLKDKIGLRYTGFDMARDHDGKIWFIEANSAPMIAVDEMIHDDEGMAALLDLTDTMFVSMAEEVGIDLGY